MNRKQIEDAKKSFAKRQRARRIASDYNKLIAVTCDHECRKIVSYNHDGFYRHQCQKCGSTTLTCNALRCGRI